MVGRHENLTAIEITIIYAIWMNILWSGFSRSVAAITPEQDLLRKVKQVFGFEIPPLLRRKDNVFMTQLNASKLAFAATLVPFLSRVVASTTFTIHQSHLPTSSISCPFPLTRLSSSTSSSTLVSNQTTLHLLGGRGDREVSPLASHQGKAASIPDRVTGFLHVGIMPGDAVGRQIFRGSPVSPPFHSGAAPYSPQSPSSAFKTSLLRAVQISSLHFSSPSLSRTQLTTLLTDIYPLPLNPDSFFHSI
ncbi:hypothetical protein PR048_017114 [Dryococelus australis]|uniref:Uncharacterized protein n=1 Tax=Dryococelus australis TaxID=614101 RepID=A0ABQ9H8M2_9NEOP|nr:hypothetical protein PR048_017114 [Dryococelus australis]